MLVLSLVRKDLLLHKRFLAISASLYTVYLAYIASRASRPMVGVVFASLLFSMLPISVAAREDRFKSLGFTLSLPVRRRDLVLSRYVLGWVLIAPLYAVMAFLAGLVPGTLTEAGGLLRADSFLSAAAFTALILSFLLPLILRYGMIGLMAFLIAIQVLFLILLLLGGGMDFGFRSVIALVPGLVRGAIASLGPAGGGFAVLAACWLMQALSFAVAVRLLKGRDF